MHAIVYTDTGSVRLDSGLDNDPELGWTIESYTQATNINNATYDGLSLSLTKAAP